MASEHAWEIDLAIIVPGGEVVVFVEDHLGSVIMQVQDDGAIEQSGYAASINFSLRLGRTRNCQWYEKSNQESHSFSLCLK